MAWKSAMQMLIMYMFRFMRPSCRQFPFFLFLLKSHCYMAVIMAALLELEAFIQKPVLDFLAKGLDFCLVLFFMCVVV